MGQGILGEGSAQAEAQRPEFGPIQGPSQRPVGGANSQKDSHLGISRILRQSRILAHNWAPVLSSEALDMGLPKTEGVSSPIAPQTKSWQRMWEGEEGHCGGQEPLEADRAEYCSPHTGRVTRGSPATYVNPCLHDKGDKCGLTVFVCTKIKLDNIESSSHSSLMEMELWLWCGFISEEKERKHQVIN